MKTYKNLTSVSTAFLIVATMGSAYADESELIPIYTQERERAEFNLQTPTADFGQLREREQKVVMHQDQNMYQYKFMGSSPTALGATGEGSMNRYMQGSATSSSIERQATGNSSMNGRR